MLPIIFKLAIPIISSKLALIRWTTPTLFEDRLNNSIISIKKINVTKANKANKQELTEEEKERGEATSKATGTKTAGPVLLILVFILNVWIFSIPPTFRRAHLCSERDTNLYPDKCITAQSWVQGIQDYYRNGGGIQFDFTIEQK